MAYSNIWLSDWSTAATIEEIQFGTSLKSTTNKYLTGYGGLGAGQGKYEKKYMSNFKYT